MALSAPRLNLIPNPSHQIINRGARWHWLDVRTSGDSDSLLNSDCRSCCSGLGDGNGYSGCGDGWALLGDSGWDASFWSFWCRSWLGRDRRGDSELEGGGFVVGNDWTGTWDLVLVRCWCWCRDWRLLLWSFGRWRRDDLVASCWNSGWDGRRLWSISTTAEKLWARDDVLGEVLVDVDEDSWVLWSVELSTNNAGWLLCSAARNDDVDTLRVVLRTITLTRGVKSDDLMSEDILSSRNIVWNLNSPCVVILDQIITCPLSRSPRPSLESGLANLEELQSGLVLAGTVASCTGSKVVDYGTVVRFWPVGPLEVDGGTGSDWDSFAKWVGSAFVADDVGVAEGGWGDKAVVEVVWDAPTGDFWFWVGELKRGRVAWKACVC